MIASTLVDFKWNNIFIPTQISFNDPYLWKPTLKQTSKREPVSITSTGTVTATSIFLREELTNDNIFDRGLISLEWAVEKNDLDLFIRLINTIHWETCTVDDYIRATNLALKVGAHLIARKLAHEGELRFPDNQEMVKIAKILAPVKTLSIRQTFEFELTKNNIWLKRHHDEYKDLWVAIRNGELLARGNSFKEVRNQVGPIKNKGILITKVY
jgi:hypothetical protein